MKKVNWVIDKYLFDEYEERLITAVKASGSIVHLYDDLCGKTFKEWISGKFTDDDIVVFHGSLQHGKQLSHLPIYPGTFMTIDNYECYKYYGYYGDNLLNSNYMLMGLNDVIRRKQEIYFRLIETKGRCINDAGLKIFIRPSNGYKSFAGQTMTFYTIEEEIDVLSKSYGGVDPETLVLLSKIQEITEEYRFIVIDGKVISGSLYMDENNMGTYKPYYDKVCTNQEPIDFATEMTKLHTPDKAYTIDVCKTSQGDYKLLEINSFNCASMYGNDYDAVVKATNELAINEYKELFEV
jgi:hypothetical protein